MKPKLLMVVTAFATSLSVNAQEKLTPELMWQLGRVSDVNVSPDAKEILYGITWYDMKENRGNRDLYVVGIAGGTPRQLTTTRFGEYNARWRPDGKKIGFISAQSGSSQIWEMNPDGSAPTQVSSVEGGVNGFFYSGDGSRIIYSQNVKVGKTVNDLYPDLPKAKAKLYDELMYRHWDSWEDFEYSHVFVAKYSEGKISDARDLMAGEAFDSPMSPFGGMEQITATADANLIAYTCKKMNGTAYAQSTNSEIYLYDAASGSTSNLTEGMQGYDQDPVFSPDGKMMTWISMERNGYESDQERLFLYDLTTKKREYLTQGFDQDVAAVNWSPDGKTIYFISGIRATYQLYSIDVKTKKITQLTKGAHDYKELDLAGNFLIGSRNSISTPVELFKIDSKTGKEDQITFTNKALLDKIKMGKVEEQNFTTSDGKKMLVWVIYPPDFDPAKKYPALLICQGGPHGAVSQSMSYRWNFQLMAANGYIVVAPNRRGLPTFGKEWNDQITGDWGGQDMRDYLTAIDSVAAAPYVDKNKLAAAGGSYGGYSVFYLAGNHNKRFKAFISHAGLFNLESFYAATEETFFPHHELGGAFWKKPLPKSYTDFSPHKFAQNWDTPMLVIHGEKDLRVPVNEGMQGFNAARLQGIPARFLYFPEENHWVSSPQNSVLWNRVFFDWLDRWVKK